MKKVIIFLMVFAIGIGCVNAVYIPDKVHSVLKKGETIYFDSTGLDWGKVYVHIWEKDGDTYKDWSNDDEMNKIEGTDNIYAFTLPNDIEEKYNMIIFHNEFGGDNNQTIDLGHIEERFAYLTTGFSDNKRVGYWYLYDKSALQTRLSDLKQYQSDKEYYTSSSYGDLDNLLTSIEQALEQEIRLEQDTNDASKYYIVVDFSFSDADDIVSNLVVNTDLLSDLITQEESKYDEYSNEFTADSLDNLKEVINSKKEVLNGTNITVDDIKNGIADINTAKQLLKEQADKKELKEQLEEIANLNKDEYTDESFSAIEDLLAEANDILTDTNKEQAEVDEMVKRLKSARNNLTKKEIKEENKVDEKESEKIGKNEEIKTESPKTFDGIGKLFLILGFSLIGFIVIVITLNKKKKQNTVH